MCVCVSVSVCVCVCLTMQDPVVPSPPAHTILSVRRKLHQSGCLQMSYSTTGSRACCSESEPSPLAKRSTRTSQSRRHWLRGAQGRVRHTHANTHTHTHTQLLSLSLSPTQT